MDESLVKARFRRSLGARCCALALLLASFGPAWLRVASAAGSAQTNCAQLAAYVDSCSTTTATPTSATTSFSVPFGPAFIAVHLANGLTFAFRLLASPATLPGNGLSVQIIPSYVQAFVPQVHVWSSPLTDAVDFGIAGPSGTVFTVLGPQVGTRIYVYNPVTNDTGWVDATGVGPSGPQTGA